MKKVTNPEFSIPAVFRDGKLTSRLLVVVLGGFDSQMDETSRLFLRQLTRLCDKSYTEYMSAREYLQEEIRNHDVLMYRFLIVSHFENCINALGRSCKLLMCLKNGLVTLEERRKNVQNPKILKKDFDIYKLMDKEAVNSLINSEILSVRNRLEHIDEDIFLSLLKEKIFLDVDEKYSQISVNGKSISLTKLSKLIETHHTLMLNVFDKLPNRFQDGEYYYDKR